MSILSLQTGYFTTLSLQEVQEASMLSRFDTKYLLPEQLFEQILPRLSEEYYLQEIDGNSCFEYRTLYFDSPDREFYLSHHNGRLHRYKMRIREYIGSDLVMLEIKEKYKGKTVKFRKRMEGCTTLEEITGSEEKMAEALRIATGRLGTKELQPSLLIDFTRMTIVARDYSERITFDWGLSYHGKGEDQSLDALVIAEIKHLRFRSSGFCAGLLHDNGIRPGSFSKYCIGIMALEPWIKHNRFKDTIRSLERVRI